MKLQALVAALAAVAGLSAAAPALAGEAVVAKLAAPVAASAKFIAGGAMFSCAGDTCVATAPTSQTYSTAACKTVAKTAGAVTSFTFAAKSLDADKISACNAAASNTQVAKR
jgi:hypothetical protein